MVLRSQESHEWNAIAYFKVKMTKKQNRRNTGTEFENEIPNCTNQV